MDVTAQLTDVSEGLLRVISTEHNSHLFFIRYRLSKDDIIRICEFSDTETLATLKRLGHIDNYTRRSGETQIAHLGEVAHTMDDLKLFWRPFDTWFTYFIRQVRDQNNFSENVLRDLAKDALSKNRFYTETKFSATGFMCLPWFGRLLHLYTTKGNRAAWCIEARNESASYPYHQFEETKHLKSVTEKLKLNNHAHTCP